MSDTPEQQVTEQQAGSAGLDTTSNIETPIVADAPASASVDEPSTAPDEVMKSDIASAVSPYEGHDEEEDSEGENLYNNDDDNVDESNAPAAEIKEAATAPTEPETVEESHNDSEANIEESNASVDDNANAEDAQSDNSGEESSPAESDDDDDDEDDNDSSESDNSSSSAEEDEEENNEKVEEDAETKTETTNESAAEASSPEVSVIEALLQRQMEYIKESKILDSEEFKTLPEQQRAHAILKLLSTNPATAMPNSDIAMSSVQISLPQGPSGNSLPPQRPLQQRPPQNTNRIDLNSPMSPREQELYNVYLQGENKITEMHNIPPKSRLFIGNLPLKNVSKEDLFRIFCPYGHILQINIKNAFGFIQYDNHESVVTAIKNESDQINFDKKLILEVSSSNARPQFDHGDHGSNSSSTFISTSKRPFEMDGYNGDDKSKENDTNYKRARRRAAECLIFVRRTADRAFATEIFNSIKNGTGLETDMMFLKPRMELPKLINDAAFDGTWGVIIINKTQTVDIQTFYKGNQGETKFDEYVNISAPDAVAIFNNLKNSKKSDANRQGNNGPYGYGQGQMNAPQPQGNYGNYGPPPQQGYGMPPQQGYNMPPQQGYNMPPQQGYGMPPQQGYGMPPQQGYGMPQQMNQGYGNYQGNAMQQPQQQQNPQLAALLGGNNGQMNQQQLLGALQNLPPNVLSNLLSAAQQQPPQNNTQPGNQKELVGLLQSAQQQQQPSGYPQGGSSSIPSQPMGQNYGNNQGSNTSSRPEQGPSNNEGNSGAGNNVQSLLDSLAKLQK